MASQVQVDLVQEVAEAVAKAVVEATKDINRPRENLSPAPERVRPKLKQRTIFCGSPEDERQLTDEQIELYNKLTPGRYHNRQWEVIKREDGNEMWMEVRLPCSTIAQRMELPPSLTAILTEMIDEAKARTTKKD